MSRSFILKLPNDTELDIIIDRDYGYEPDTQAWDIDWSYQSIEGDYIINEAESEFIYEKICDYLRNDYNYGEF